MTPERFDDVKTKVSIGGWSPAWYAKIADELVEHGDQQADEISRLRAAISGIDKTLRVPAAEYVPAIGDAFGIIDRLNLKGKT